MARYSQTRRSYGRVRTIVKRIRPTGALRKMKKKHTITMLVALAAGIAAFFYKDKIKMMFHKKPI